MADKTHNNQSHPTNQSSVGNSEPTAIAEPRPVQDYPSWKPWCYHPLFIISLLAFQLILIGLLEAVVRLAAKASPDRLMSTDGSTSDGSITFQDDDAGAYFVWQYFPAIYTVSLAMLWEIVDISVRHYEPYYLLARPSGATASEALTLDYISPFPYFIPFMSAWRGHWAVSLSSSVYALSQLVLPTLVSNSWDINLLVRTADRSSGKYQVSVNEHLLRASQGLSGLMVILGLTLLLLVRSRKSGLIRNPSCIADIVSLTCESSIVEFFRHIPSYESNRTINTMLRGATFGMQYLGTGNEDGSPGETAYQIVPLTRDPSTAAQASPAYQFKQSRREAHPTVLWGRTVLVIELLLAVPAITIQVGAVYNDFLPPLVVKGLYTFSTTVVAYMWQAIQEQVFLLEPFIELTRPSSSISPSHNSNGSLGREYISLLPLYTLFRAFRDHLAVVFWISLSSFLSRVMILILPPFLDRYLDPNLDLQDLPAVPWKGLEVLRGFTYTIAILQLAGFLCMLLTRRKAFMPRKPFSLASKILYVCNSDELLTSLRGTSKKDGKDFKEHLKGLAGLHAFGFFNRGEDWIVGFHGGDVYEYEYGKTRPEVKKQILQAHDRGEP